jgi:hypothetical protein
MAPSSDQSQPLLTRPVVVLARSGTGRFGALRPDAAEGLISKTVGARAPLASLFGTNRHFRKDCSVAWSTSDRGGGSMVTSATCPASEITKPSLTSGGKVASGRLRMAASRQPGTSSSGIRTPGGTDEGVVDEATTAKTRKHSMRRSSDAGGGGWKAPAYRVGEGFSSPNRKSD